MTPVKYHGGRNYKTDALGHSTHAIHSIPLTPSHIPSQHPSPSPIPSQPPTPSQLPSPSLPLRGRPPSARGRGSFASQTPLGHATPCPRPRANPFQRKKPPASTLARVRHLPNPMAGGSRVMAAGFGVTRCGRRWCPRRGVTPSLAPSAGRPKPPFGGRPAGYPPPAGRGFCPAGVAPPKARGRAPYI